GELRRVERRWQRDAYVITAGALRLDRPAGPLLEVRGRLVETIDDHPATLHRSGPRAKLGSPPDGRSASGDVGQHADLLPAPWGACAGGLGARPRRAGGGGRSFLSRPVGRQLGRIRRRRGTPEGAGRAGGGIRARGRPRVAGV